MYQNLKSMTRLLRLQSRLKLPAMLLLYLLLPLATVAAQDRHWKNDNGGGFSDSRNWDTGVPSATEDAIFDLNGAFEVGLASDQTVGSFQQSDGNVTLFGGSKVDLKNGRQLQLNHKLVRIGNRVSGATKRTDRQRWSSERRHRERDKRCEIQWAEFATWCVPRRPTKHWRRVFECQFRIHCTCRR